MTFTEKQVQTFRDLLAASPEDPMLAKKLKMSEKILALRQQGDFYWDYGDKLTSQRYHDDASRLSTELKAL